MKKTVSTILLFLFSLNIAYSKSEIRIGAPLPLTGKLSLEGAKQHRGYQLWADKVNQQGGIEVSGVKHLVKIIYNDYQSNSDHVIASVESLVEEHKVHLLFAPYGSGATRQASPVAQRYKIPMIAVTASSTQAYNRGHQFLFGIFSPNNTLIEPLVGLVKANIVKNKNIALIVRQDLFPQSLAREVQLSAKLNYLDIIYYEKYQPNSNDYTTLINKLKPLQPDWIIVLGYTNDLVNLTKQLHQLSLAAPIMTMIAAPAYQEFIDKAGHLSENITTSAWWHPAVRYTGIDIFTTTENFVAQFEQRYNKTPDYVEASAALAGALFQIAIQRANSLNGDLIRKQLASLDITTFWGPVHFANNGQNSAPSTLVLQIQQGKHIILSPPKIATGKLKVITNDQQIHQ